MLLCWVTQIGTSVVKQGLSSTAESDRLVNLAELARSSCLIASLPSLKNSKAELCQKKL